MECIWTFSLTRILLESCDQQDGVDLVCDSKQTISRVKHERTKASSCGSISVGFYKKNCTIVLCSGDDRISLISTSNAVFAVIFGNISPTGGSACVLGPSIPAVDLLTDLD